MGSGLDVSQANEPVEKALNGLTDRADKCRESVTRNQEITFKWKFVERNA